MTCRQCQQLLSPSLDHALSEVEDKDLSTHLRECTSCQKILRQLEDTRQLLHSLPTSEVTLTMEEQLWERLKYAKTPQNRWWKLPPSLHQAREGAASVSRLVSWRYWRGLSVGTLVTAAAALFLYVAAPLERRDPITAVAFSNQLLEALEYDQKMLSEDPAEIPTWPEETSAWDTANEQD